MAPRHPFLSLIERGAMREASERSEGEEAQNPGPRRALPPRARGPAREAAGPPSDTRATRTRPASAPGREPGRRPARRQPAGAGSTPTREARGERGKVRHYVGIET